MLVAIDDRNLGQGPQMRPVSFEGCFGWLHMPPDQAAGTTAVVLCQGLGSDALTGHRSFRRLADALAALGYPALRFDYPGTGDAAVPPAGAEYWSLWQHSIHAAADWLRRQSGAQRIILCGLRFGATLAAVAAQTRADVAGLVLLAPVLRGRTWLRQLSLEAKLPISAPAENGLALDEFTFSGATVERINQVDLRRVKLPQNCPVAIHAQEPSPILTACVAAWRSAGATVTEADFAGLEPMLRPTFLNHEASADFTRITAWLRHHAPPKGPGEQADHPRRPFRPRTELHTNGAIETPLWFGRHGNLFGMLCRPSGRQAHGAAVVIANSGGNPHYGHAGGGTELARQLAIQGVASLRIDFAGLGDSVTPGDIPTHVFEADRRSDITAAIDALERFGFRHFAVHGICSGAYHAFHAGLADPRIAALLLVNPPLFQWRPGFPLQFLNRVRQDRSLTLRKLVSRTNWRLLVNGRLDLRDRLVEKILLLQQNGGAKRWRRDSHRPDFALSCLRRLSWHARTLFLLAEGDASVPLVADALHARQPPPGVSVQVVAGMTHALEARSMQRIAAGHMIAFLQQDRRFRLTRTTRSVRPLPSLMRAVA